MDWLFWALLSPIIYTIVNFADKYVVEREMPDARSVPIFLALVHGIIGTALWLLSGAHLLPPTIALPLIFTGIFTIAGSFMLFRALAQEETSKIVVWTQLLPVITLLLAVPLLNEILNLPQLIGFALILVAALGLSVEPGAWQPSATFRLVMLSIMIWAISDIVFKLVLNANPQFVSTATNSVDLTAFLTIIIYQSWGFALGGLVIYIVVTPVRRAFHHSLRNARTLGYVVIFLNEGVFIGRQYARSLAIALGPVALVSVIEGGRVFLSIVVGWLLTQIAPATFRENTSRSGLLRKAVFSVILFGGIILISLAEGR